MYIYYRSVRFVMFCVLKVLFIPTKYSKFQYKYKKITVKFWREFLNVYICKRK